MGKSTKEKEERQPGTVWQQDFRRARYCHSKKIDTTTWPRLQKIKAMGKIEETVVRLKAKKRRRGTRGRGRKITYRG